jgi:RimJ/RimL family protein N-acetyltransferase
MKLIQCNSSYWEFIRNLRNDKHNIEGFINKTYITEQDQINYMKKYNDYYYVCIDEDNTPLGFIGEIDNDIRICVDHLLKNKGVGKFMLREFLNIKNNKQIFAKIKINNTASHQLFISMGFKPKYIIYEQE